MNRVIKIFKGDAIQDKRGSVSFVNSFRFKDIKRFYQLENSKTHEIRAFHGHMMEAKYFYVASGSILLCLIKLDQTHAPSKETTIKRIFLSAKKPSIVFVPPGFANGFKILEDNTKVIVFSTASLEESLTDDYRYPYDYWGESIWKK